MGHTITLDDKSKLLDKDTLQDFIDLFFDARDSEFLIEVVPTYGPVPNPGIRGLMAASNLGRFRITLYAGNIKAHMERGLSVGGNNSLTKDLKLGVYLVLTHELRHAYQHIYFGTNSTLQKGRYKARAGEVDARRHVDENYDYVCDFLGFKPELVRIANDSQDIVILLDLLAEGASQDGIITESEDDIWDNAMSMPGDPEVTHRKIMDGMVARGLRLG
jgi:hypothetical protein